MIYKGYEITAEVTYQRAEYSLDDNGEPDDFLRYIDENTEIITYCIIKNGDIVEWIDTLDEVKQCIDKLIKEKNNG